jgi:hypothetical protein
MYFNTRYAKVAIMEGTIGEIEQAVAVESIFNDTIRREFENTLEGPLERLKYRFGEAMDDRSQGNEKYERIAEVQQDLTVLLWCYGQVTKVPDKLDPSFVRVAKHRSDVEERLRRTIFDPSNPDSFVNVRGSGHTQKFGEELCGVVSTLAFLRLMEKYDRRFTGVIKPSRVLATLAEDTIDKVDIKILGKTANLVQLKSGPPLVESFPFHKEKEHELSQIIDPKHIDHIDHMRVLGQRIFEQGKYGQINIFAVQVPTLVNGEAVSVNVFGTMHDKNLSEKFKDKAIAVGLIKPRV